MPRSDRRPQIYRRPGSTNLWLRYYDEHERLIRRTAGTPDEQVAQQFLQSRLKEVEERQRGHSDAPISVKVGFTLSMTIETPRPPTSSRHETSLTQSIDSNDRDAIEQLSQLMKTALRRFIDDNSAQ
jgi:hypothetical protein